MGHKKVERIDPLSRALPLGGVDSHAHLGTIRTSIRTVRMFWPGPARQGWPTWATSFWGLMISSRAGLCSTSIRKSFFCWASIPATGGTARRESLAAMRAAFATEPRLRAVGEIGLDFHWQDCPKELQFKAFTEQLDLARELDAPRGHSLPRGEDECLMTLEARGFAGYPLLWHCFGGGPALARRILDNGWHISVPGPATYPANAALRQAAAIIPADRLLLETDSPYLSPIPWRGKRNEPAPDSVHRRLWPRRAASRRKNSGWPAGKTHAAFSS